MRSVYIRFLAILLFFICGGTVYGETVSPAATQDEQKIFSIVMVSWRGITDAEKGFMEYLERQNVQVEYTFLDVKKDKSLLPGFVKQIKEIQPDLVYVFGTSGSVGLCGTKDNHPAEKYITEIPVVFNIVSVPVKSGLVETLETSGRNITGASHVVPLESQMKAIQSLFDLRSLGVVYNPQEKNSLVAVADLEKLSEEMGFTFYKAPFAIGADQKTDPASIPSTVQGLAEKEPQVIYLPSDSFLVANAREVVAEINSYKIPSFSATEVPIKKGQALTGLVSRYYNVGQLAGYKAEQILVYKKAPKDIPMETLSRFSFMFNMVTAKQLEFYPPLSVLKVAEILQ